MTFLELARKLRQEAEITGTGPSSTSNQVGELKRVVDWTAEAWKDIQRRHANWRWMRRAFTFNTVANDDTYAYGDVTDVDAVALISRFSRWWANDACDPFQSYLQSGGVAGQYRLLYMPWQQFKWIYRHGTQTSNRPVHVSVDHLDQLVLGPKPDAVYVVTGDFQRGVQVLSGDDAEPELPADFHELIAYWALAKYGANSVALEIFSRAQLESNRLMRALERGQLPDLELAEPLA